MKTFRIILFLSFICAIDAFFAPSLQAQESLKSNTVTEYNGKKFYIHTVKKKQSLNDIAEIYGVTVYDILSENKDLKKTNPKAGTIIRIPYKEIIVEEVVVEDEILEQDTTAYVTEFVPTTFDSERLYKVALMMPLYLEQVDEKFLSEEPNNKQLLAKPFSYLHFYEGFMIAVDSMISKYDMKIDLRVYDVDQDTNKVVAALNDEWLNTSDIIVGPFHLKPFERVNAFANEHEIMIVNPMTLREDLVVGNKNMVKVKPSYSSQMEWLEKVIADKYTDNNIFVFTMDTSNMDYARIIEEIALRNINEFSNVPNKHIKRIIKKQQNALKNEEIEFDSTRYMSDNVSFDVAMINEFPDDTTKLRNQVVIYNYSIDSLNIIKNTASAFRNNLVIVYGDDKVFATEMINKLNIFSKDHPISLIALPDWSKHDRLFNENLMKLSTIVFDDDYTDYNTYPVGIFICRFRDKYGTEPKDMAYHGFNIGWYFLNALMNYGDNINVGIETYYIPLLNTRYDFQRKSEFDGCDNTYWNIYQYKDYQKNLLNF